MRKFTDVLAALVLAITAAFLVVGCGGWSDDEQQPPPATPTSLTVEPGDEVTTVQWPAVKDATSYNLYYSETTPVTKASSQVITGAVSPYTHTGRTNGKTLYYAVAAVNANGESELSGTMGAMPVAPVPAAPVALTVTPGDQSTTIAWAPVARAVSYNLYWSLSADVAAGKAGVTKIEGISGTSYMHVGLTNGQRYYYAVTAVNTGGESVASIEGAAVPLPPAPGAPSNLAATAGDGQVLLSWSATLDALSYNVYWSDAAGVVPGAAGVTQISGINATSYLHTGLTNGDTYHYVVTAMNIGGESAASAEVSARPLPPPPPAPIGVTALAPRDVTQVTVQWFDVTDYPSDTAPITLGYNLYRGLEPGLASYYKDAARATKIANVVAPFVDAGVSTATTYYYVVTSFVPAIPDVESVPSGEVSATTGRAGGGTGGGGGGHDVGFGNNLSVPLIFADAHGLAGAPITGSWPGAGPFTTPPAFDANTGLRPLSTETLTAFPNLDASTAVTIGGVTYYPQKTASTWQAEWRSNASGAPLDVIVDWGDALISRSYTTNSMIRVETTLKQDATVPGITDTMTAYRMQLLSGSGITELQGTDATTFTTDVRNVFAVNARLTIEKISTSGGPDLVIFDKAIYESLGEHEEGGGITGRPEAGYTAEMNVGGALVYGYNFRLSSVTGVPDKTGQYRITFSLDPTATIGTTTVPNHVKMIKVSDTAATLSPSGLSTSVIVTVN